MNSNFRWRWGETNPIIANVASATVIHIGDLLWMDVASKTVKPAGAVTYTGSVTNGQPKFAAAFIGVAMQASPEGSETPIRIATSGTFQFDRFGSDLKLGQLTGVTNGGSGNTLKNQVVTHVGDKTYAIGRVTHVHNVEAGTAYVSIRSTVIHGGVTGNVMDYGSSSTSS